MYEARIAGVGFFEALEYTWGELVEMTNVYTERERRNHQHESLIAFRQAELIAGWVWKKNEISVMDCFPYWSEEDKKQAALEKYKQRMMKYASK